MTRRQPTSTLFPYTSLFRSNRGGRPAREIISTAARAGVRSDGTGSNRASRKQSGSGISCRSAGRSSLRSEEHSSELQSRGHLVCRLLLEKKKKICKRQIEYQ